jgi:hypothetical protein|tara:strand:+ start:42529 stop:42795 length:267 start_codon:yes stop_codon:yes gene_type:complete
MGNNNTGQMLYDLMVLERSADWLDHQVSTLIGEIETEESKDPQDEEVLSSLGTQLRVLFKRCAVEAKIADQLNDKYEFTSLETGKRFA